MPKRNKDAAQSAFATYALTQIGQDEKVSANKIIAGARASGATFGSNQNMHAEIRALKGDYKNTLKAFHGQKGGQRSGSVRGAKSGNPEVRKAAAARDIARRAQLGGATGGGGGGSTAFSSWAQFYQVEEGRAIESVAAGSIGRYVTS